MGKKKVGVGLLLLAMVATVVAVAVAVFAARHFQNLKDLDHPAKAHLIALDILGTEYLPVGYSAIDFTSAGSDTVFLSAKDLENKDPENEALGDRIFVFSLDKSPTPTKVSLASQDSRELIRDGMIEISGGLASYQAHRGEVPVMDQTKRGIVAELEIRCERDSFSRNAAWLTPDPDASQPIGEVNLQGTSADEAALTNFLSLFQFCPTSGPLQEWAEFKAVAQEARPGEETGETDEEFLDRVREALRSGIAARIEALHYGTNAGTNARTEDDKEVALTSSPLHGVAAERVSIEPLPRTYKAERPILPLPVGFLVIDRYNGQRVTLPYGKEGASFYLSSAEAGSNPELTQQDGPTFAPIEEKLLKITLIGDSTARVKTVCRIEANGKVVSESSTMNGGGASAHRGQRFKACMFRKEGGGKVRVALTEGEDRVFDSGDLELGKKVRYPKKQT